MADQAAGHRSLPTHSDRRRAESFGDQAEQYERSRPSYPPELVDDLLADGTTRVLDVGCGTGKAARLFAQRGCTVTGVEPDGRMAAIARSHGVQVEVSVFEDWAPPDEPFDLLISGQAWHWVEPRAGAQKAMAVLRPGGRFAAFWNEYETDPDVRTALRPAYEAHAPDLVKQFGVVAGRHPERTEQIEALRGAGFVELETRKYRWKGRYSTDAWLDQLPTHSNHRMLPAGTLRALLEAVGRVIDGLGGEIVVHHDTSLITARTPMPTV